MCASKTFSTTFHKFAKIDDIKSQIRIEQKQKNKHIRKNISNVFECPIWPQKYVVFSVTKICF